MQILWWIYANNAISLEDDLMAAIEIAIEVAKNVSDIKDITVMLDIVKCWFTESLLLLIFYMFCKIEIVKNGNFLTICILFLRSKSMFCLFVSLLILWWNQCFFRDPLNFVFYLLYCDEICILYAFFWRNLRFIRGPLTNDTLYWRFFKEIRVLPLSFDEIRIFSRNSLFSTIFCRTLRFSVILCRWLRFTVIFWLMLRFFAFLWQILNFIVAILCLSKFTFYSQYFDKIFVSFAILWQIICFIRDTLWQNCFFGDHLSSIFRIFVSGLMTDFSLFSEPIFLNF